MHYLDPQVRIPGVGKVPSSRMLSQILQENEVKIQVPYAPRAVFKPFHQRSQRFAIIVAHRRCGKTVAAVNDDIRHLMKIKREFPEPQAAFISPTFAQGKRNAWGYAKHYTKTIPGVKISESELTITLPNQGKYIFAGSDNYEPLRGLYLDKITLDEYGSQKPQIWGDIIRPALSDFGGKATFIGSAKGRNHFYDLLKRHEDDPEWYISTLKASQTGIISEEELEAARQTMTEAQYEQEYECNFEAAITGAYYGKDIAQADTEGRITHIPYDRASPVYAGWDIGIADHMALWTFQVIGLEYHFLHYYANYNESLTHYADWVKSLPYKVETNFLPHDAKARETQTGKSREEFLEGLNLNIEIVPKGKIEDGIQAVRMILNRAYFDKKGTYKGVDCLRMYESEFSEENKVLSLKPKHNWASHGADAFRTAIMGVEERRKKYTHPEDLYRGEESWLA